MRISGRNGLKKKLGGTNMSNYSNELRKLSEESGSRSGSQKWKDTMKEFVENTMNYLEQYHQRSNSESGFAADKRMLGWNIAQRRDDRIDSALFCTGVWHNLFNMGRS